MIERILLGTLAVLLVLLGSVILLCITALLMGIASELQTAWSSRREKDQ